MAAAKAKKPVSKKLKAGKKKKTNKWLILGGIVAVAIIGAAVVRFSSAAKWYAVRVDTDQESFGPTQVSPSRGTSTAMIQLRSGRNYRYCVTGHGNGGVTNTTLSFSTYNTHTSIKPIRDRDVADSPKAYGATNEKHCTATFKTTKSYWVRGWIMYRSGKSMTINTRSFEELR